MINNDYDYDYDDHNKFKQNKGISSRLWVKRNGYILLIKNVLN